MVKGKALPPPEPHAVWVFEIVPMVSNVAQPAVPPALETMRLVVEAVPLTASRALGLVVPMPTLPPFTMNLPPPERVEVISPGEGGLKAIEPESAISLLAPTIVLLPLVYPIMLTDVPFVRRDLRY